MTKNRCSKILSALLIFIAYHLILLVLALLNTAIWTTELPRFRLFHHSSLYAIVKGFNVFFGILIIITIIIICYKIGYRVLMIANLRNRANYNFYLFIFSFIIVIFVPIIYVATARQIGTLLKRENLTNFAILTLICFVAFDALILFVFAIFLLLTALMSTLRSYNIFRHLVKLHEEETNVKKKRLRTRPPARPGKKIPVNKRRRQTQLRRSMPVGVYHTNRSSLMEPNLPSNVARFYRVTPVMMQRYGYNYVVTPTLTPSYSSPDLAQPSTSTDYQHPLSESTVFLV